MKKQIKIGALIILVTFLAFGNIFAEETVGGVVRNGIEYDEQGRYDEAIRENSKEIKKASNVLEGIFFDAGGKSSAIIDGKVVFEGDSVGDIKVDKININSVDIEVKGQKINMKVEEGKGDSIKKAEEKGDINLKQAANEGNLEEVTSSTTGLDEEKSEVYNKAKSYYREAISSDNPVIALRLYDKAINYAQDEMPHHSEEMASIIDKSRKNKSDCQRQISKLKSKNKIILGMTKQDIKSIKGTPTKVEPLRDGYEKYFYAYSKVHRFFSTNPWGERHRTSDEYYIFNDEGILISIE